MSRSTGYPVSDAQDRFTTVRRRQILLNLLRKLSGRVPAARQVARLTTGTAGLMPAGPRIIEIAAVVGSVDKSHEFDPEFRPRSARCRSRWVQIAARVLQGDSLPPISVYDLNGRYFVRDGHHRVSVARALGIDIIEAQVQPFFPIDF